MDKALQENVEDGERYRTLQAPNSKGVWSRSQQLRERAMVGPRFEQTIMEDQVCYCIPICRTRSYEVSREDLGLIA
jgi:hypothetical protein